MLSKWNWIFYLSLAAGAWCPALGHGDAQAQVYPSRPVRLLVPTVPGGGLDLVARLMAPQLTESLDKPVVVDNRPGASGAIALDITARAASDGHTLVVFSVSQVIHAELNKTPYDMFRDFAPVSQTAAAPYVLTVNPSLPMKSVKDFVAYAKANPRKLNYASSGVATLQQLATEWLALETGIALVHVPYKGIGQAFPDLLSGRTQMTMSSLSAMSALIRSKGVRPLAVTSAKRATMLPDVPTMTEAGVPGFVVTQWHGMLAPAGTPPRVLERLHREIVKALRQPDVAARLAADGTDAVGSAPRELAAHMKSERDVWVRVIKRAGIQAN